jgi:hypothetical protein
VEDVEGRSLADLQDKKKMDITLRPDMHHSL